MEIIMARVFFSVLCCWTYSALIGNTLKTKKLFQLLKVDDKLPQLFLNEWELNLSNFFEILGKNVIFFSYRKEKLRQTISYLLFFGCQPMNICHTKITDYVII
jgi:hypothetical protein